MKQPDLCQTLNYFNEYFDNTSSCEKWPKDFLDDHGTPNDTLVKGNVQIWKGKHSLVKVVNNYSIVPKREKNTSLYFQNLVYK